MSRLHSSASPSSSPIPQLPAGQGDSPQPDEIRGASGDSPQDTEPGSAPQIAQQESSRSSPGARKYSDREEGYPSWLPKRPPPPAPASTRQSSSVMPSGYDESVGVGSPTDSYGRAGYHGVGRRPTPRSVRIVSVGTNQGDVEKNDVRYGRNREPTEQSRMGQPAHPRVWSRGTAAMSPTVYSTGSLFPSPHHRPRFRAPALHVELLRSPSAWTRLRFYLYPLFVFAHIPLQTFFDFNAVFVLLQVSKFPNPVAPGVPGSGRNWALGAAAYIACWLVWILAVFVVYELIYSFYRRWRVKRPLIVPIYLSSPAFNFACMTSYSHFCFLQHIRESSRPPLPFSLPFRSSSSASSSRSQPRNSPSPSAQSPPLASWRDFFAETFFFYSQNIPTVTLLLPRAALCLTILLAFSAPQPEDAALGNSGLQQRDGTFFRDDGALTDYARGVLIANAAWTAWRVLVLFISWVGLWILSGQACAGICGPRYRWQEEDAEKTMSIISTGSDDYADGLAWSWKECTQARVQEAFDFCLTARPPRWSSLSHPARGDARGKKEVSEGSEWAGAGAGVPYEGFEQVLAAAGLPSAPLPARRGILNYDLFEGPEGPVEQGEPREFSEIIPPIAGSSKMGREDSAEERGGPSGPLMALPYPFKGYPAQASSDEPRIPFPPSPTEEVGPRGEDVSDEERGDGAAEGEEESEDHEDDEEEVEVEVEEAEEEEEAEGEEGHPAAPDELSPSSGRASGSMSSLGQPIPSRYPFQFRRPDRTSRGGRSSVGTAQSKSGSSRQTDSTPSRQSQSTGNRESTDSPWSHNGGSSGFPSPSAASPTSPIPMPPRHPQRRERAGTTGSLPHWSVPVIFPGRIRARTRTESGSTAASRTFGPQPVYESSGDEEDDPAGVELDPEDEGLQEAAEREDSVGLLSAAPSPRSSLGALRARASNLSSHRRGRNNSGSGSTSGSGSNSRSGSTSNSRSESARSRAQSLIQSLGAASRSSLSFDLAIRSRANSMARLSESESPEHSGAGSQAGLSSPEDHTFGQPMRMRLESSGDEPQPDVATSQLKPDLSSEVGPPMRESPSIVSSAALSEHSEQTISGGSPAGPSVLAHPILRPRTEERAQSYISSARDSFVTAPASIEGTSETTGRTPSSWGEVQHYVPDHREGGGNWRPA